MKNIYLLICCLSLNANAMLNPYAANTPAQGANNPVQQDAADEEPRRDFSFFNVIDTEARESIYSEDPAEVARRLCRPHRPPYGGFREAEDDIESTIGRPNSFAVLSESPQVLDLPCKRLSF